MTERTGRGRAQVVAAIAIGLALTLVSCAESLSDREGPEGDAPDRVLDVDYVEVYRNADNFPNVARVCAAGLGFATTSTGSDVDAPTSPSLVRVTDWDEFCAARVARR